MKHLQNMPILIGLKSLISTWDTPATKTYYNHTACAMRCVCMKNHNPECPDRSDRWCKDAVCPNNPYEVEVTWCPSSSPWNVSTCKCEPLVKGSSRENEGCGSSVNINVLVSAMVGQFLLFVIAQFVFQRYRCLECGGTSNVDKETDV